MPDSYAGYGYGYLIYYLIHYLIQNKPPAVSVISYLVSKNHVIFGIEEYAAGRMDG